MPKIAIAIESDAPGQWKLTRGPSEDVTDVLAYARAQSVLRGGGEASLLVLTTNGLEKRYKIGPALPTTKAKGK